MEDRVFQFAHTLLQANMPVQEVYQECIVLIQAIMQQDNKTLIVHQITPHMMEMSAKAVLDAQNKISDDMIAKYRMKPVENWLELEKKV